MKPSKEGSSNTDTRRVEAVHDAIVVTLIMCLSFVV